MSKLSKKLTEAGVNDARRHLFFCIGPDCCHKSDGEALWEYAKKRIRQLDVPVMRTKAGCFRICRDGPWLVVYPEGTWYGQVDQARMERILQEHVLGGRPVEEWVTATNPLGGGGLTSGGE
jgi:(2Fe-2S) ferredoxin